MARFPGAVIFDMDGVLINSEPLWRVAMVKVFREYGMPATEEECRQTMGMRIAEVIALWLTKYRLDVQLAAEIERRVMDQLLALIESEGQALAGVEDTLAFCSQNRIPCGLATSSSEELMNAVLKKLKISAHFAAVESAEKLRYGKPHPEVFLRCAESLGVEPANCLVIEDSLNGVIAAKAAAMRVIAVPDDEHLHPGSLRLQQFTLADFRAGNMIEALEKIKELYDGQG